MIPYKTGDIDPSGNIVLRHKGPVYLWKSPSGYHKIYLYVEDDLGLNTVRKDRKTADTFFDSVCDMLP